jgi:nitroreductase
MHRSRRLAPSACNAQPWKFIVVDDPDTRSKLAAEAFSGIYSISRFARQAPILIAITSSPAWLPRAGGEIRKTDFHLIDIGIAGEHFVLRAAELGLGTCWIGWFDESKAKKVLQIPPNEKIEVMLSLGYPAGEVATNRQQRKPLEQVACFNRYGDPLA